MQMTSIRADPDLLVCSRRQRIPTLHLCLPRLVLVTLSTEFEAEFLNLNEHRLTGGVKFQKSNQRSPLQPIIINVQLGF